MIRGGEDSFSKVQTLHCREIVPLRVRERRGSFSWRNGDSMQSNGIQT